MDGAENIPRDGDESSGNNVDSSAEHTDHGVGIFCGQDCGEAFREKAVYTGQHHQQPQESVYLNNQLDGLHNAEMDSKTTPFCTLCKLSFVELSEFHLHMEKNHGETSQKESGIQMNAQITKQHTYECPECGKCYGVIGHFLNHQRSHRQASKSVFHDLEHLKKKSFQCESCGRNYSRASALDAHRRCHEEKLVKPRNRSSGDLVHSEEPVVDVKPSVNQTDETPENLFKCSCGKAFSALMRLRTHQRFSRNTQCSPEELKEKPKKTCNDFYCSECKKSFSGHIALFNHQRWHSNHSDDSAKRFPCEECGKVFMTLTFYYRHRRTVHSEETPAKSFLHQVCQLQKKAFECKDCGLKFSRASALHSHQLHHTDVFKETEKKAQIRTSLLPQQKVLDSDRKEIEQLEEKVELENVLPICITEEESQANETHEDLESYEPWDFNVQVISASESEDDPIQDQNPDLELLCESDQEVQDNADTEVSPSGLISKPEMDLKIVQIDFDEQCAPIAREAENNAAEERFDCPECYRWFSSASSLRVHRMWHGVHKRRQQTQVKPRNIECKDCGLTFTHWEVFKTHLHQHALEEGEEQMRDDMDECDVSSSLQTNHSGLIQGDGIISAPVGNKFRKVYSCLICGKVYIYLVSFRKHQQLHEAELLSSKEKSQSVQSLNKYECPDCGMTFVRRTRLLGHLQVHRAHKEFKTKPPRCDQCNKNFTSIKAWMIHIEIHKQKPFWCLSCAKGFRDEVSLDKHLQGHSLKQHNCDVCCKTFRSYARLMCHYNTHSHAKPYHCPLCGRGFSHLGNLILHRKRHLYGCNRKSLGIKNIRAKKQIIKKRLVLTSVKEEPEMDTQMDELPENEESVEKSESQSPCQDAEFGDDANSEESDCGEPMHGIKLSKPHDESKSQSVQPQKGLDESEPQEENVHREHKYWEWECFECDMGFDDVAELHLHYIKHATGELPFPQDDI